MSVYKNFNETVITIFKMLDTNKINSNDLACFIFLADWDYGIRYDDKLLDIIWNKDFIYTYDNEILPKLLNDTMFMSTQEGIHKYIIMKENKNNLDKYIMKAMENTIIEYKTNKHKLKNIVYQKHPFVVSWVKEYFDLIEHTKQSKNLMHNSIDKFDGKNKRYGY